MVGQLGRGPEGTRDHNEGKAVVNSRMAVGVTVILPDNSHVFYAHSHPETYVVTRGSAVAVQGGPTAELGRLDAIYFPPEKPHAIRNSGEEPMYLLWVHDDLARWNRTVR